ncbi:MAG: hypothetical protein R6X02_29715 [Enhygromyxa sp.]
MRDFPWVALGLFGFTFALALACHQDDREYVGQPCETPADCYPNLDDPSVLAGEVECLDKVDGGYCTHLCESDDDCCAVEGECVAGYPQVCAPFENQPDKRCFLSCEDGDLDGLAPDEYCRTYAHPSFGCRSTGGGAENRKVCVP